MPEEKEELTIEEMKSAVSMAAVLPALLKEINEINEALVKLSNEFKEMKTKFNDNTKAVIAYKEEVENFENNLPDFESIEKKISAIQTSLFLVQSHYQEPTPVKTTRPIKEQPKEQEKKPTPQSAPKAEKKVDVKKEMEKEEINRIIDEILRGHRGRKTRLLTSVQIKQGFRCSDEMAERVLKSLEDKKMYNPKNHTLTFPKR